jgi:putrescine transport system substrate-binding protein
VANAYRFLDFLMEAKVAATSIEVTGYTFANRAAMALLPKQMLDNPLIYPTAEMRRRFYSISVGDTEQIRDIDRRWMALKRDR